MIKAILRETKGAVAAMEQGVEQVANGTVEGAKKSATAAQELNASAEELELLVKQFQR